MILVTGGGGYVGSELVPVLLNAGHSVRVVDTFWFGNSLPPNPRLEIAESDLVHCDHRLLEGVDAVIHLAGLSNDVTAEFAPDLSIHSNILATRAVATAASQLAARQERE